MNDGVPLKTLKEVAECFGRPPHRIIHLCESGTVRPTVGAAGRGSVRRFSRDDTFRVLLALHLQDAGAQAPLIGPWLTNLSALVELPEIARAAAEKGESDLIGAVSVLGTEDSPVLAYLTAPARVAARVAVVVPGLPLPTRPGAPVEVHGSAARLQSHFVSVVVNLTETAQYVSKHLWKNDRQSLSDEL